MAVFNIVERVLYRIDADSAQEALDQYLNDDSDSYFVGVEERYVYDEHMQQLDVEDF